MDDFTKEILEKYPYLEPYTKDTIFITKEELDFMNDDLETVIVDDKLICSDIFYRILSDDKFYDYAQRLVKGEIKNLKVTSIKKGDFDGTITFSRAEIVKGMKKFIDFDSIQDEKVEKKYNSIVNSITYENFLNDYKGKKYNIEIDGISYVIGVDAMMNVLTSDNFDNLTKDGEIIMGIPNQHFLYATYKFFEENQIINNYAMPQNVVNRYKDLENNRSIDLFAIDKHLKTTDTLYKKIKVNKDLEELILKDMPKNLSDLEKAVYIYIKMCRNLTYDDEFYAVDQKGEVAERHRNIEYVSTISPTNNKLVCFEFNLIYSKLLSDLNINFSTEYKGMVEEVYGEGHAHLEFRSGKFIIKADAVTSILQGDLTKAKTGQLIDGLSCQNSNTDTKMEFNRIVSSMYKLISQQEKNKEKETKPLEELLEEYSNVTTNFKEVGLEEKMLILLEKINELDGIDALAYSLFLRKRLFTEMEINRNIKINILRDNQTKDGRVAMASAIITLNPDDYNKNVEKSIYCYYSPGNKLRMISREELQKLFDNGTMGYISETDPSLPGIEFDRGIKNDR